MMEPICGRFIRRKGAICGRPLSQHNKRNILHEFIEETEPRCAYEYLTPRGALMKVCGEFEEVHTHGHDFVPDRSTNEPADKEK